jgi:hypothetical protein
MDMRKYSASPVRPDDVRDGPRQETIVDVSINERYDCPVLHFESGDSLMLSPPNSRIMGRAYTTKSENWLRQVVDSLARALHRQSRPNAGRKRNGCPPPHLET